MLSTVQNKLAIVSKTRARARRSFIPKFVTFAFSFVTFVFASKVLHA